MYINYRRLFNLRINHSYYADGVPAGIQIHPASSTSKKLSGYKMLLKHIPGGITVLYRADHSEIEPLVRLDQLKLTFYITTQNATVFQSITNLDDPSGKSFRSSSVLYFKNDPENGSSEQDEPEPIIHSLLDYIRPQLFTFSFSKEDSPDVLFFRLKNEIGERVAPGKDASGNQLPDQLFLEKPGDGVFRQQVDLRGRQAGVYSISLWEEEDDDEPYHEETFYVDDQLSERALLGILELEFSEEQGDFYSEIQEYEIRFERRKTYWKYLVVDKHSRLQNPETLVIEEAELIEDEYYDSVTFSRVEAPPGEQRKIDGKEAYAFKSNDPIPFFEIPKGSIQLKESASKTLISHLPNASPRAIIKENGDQLESEIYVFV